MAVVITLSTACTAVSVPQVPTPRVPVGPPGQLLSPPLESAGFPALDALAAKALKIRYRSTSAIDGSLTSVSGVIFVPDGDPPPGGWIVASIAHATAGETNDCAPSNSPGLQGSLPEAVVALTDRYLVVMSDYQGLGSAGPHPYLEPTTAAYNVIDAVRAAREAVPDTSRTWVTFGQSQGGQAAWAANELAGQYGKGLHLAAAIAVSPPTDLRRMVDEVEKGTLTEEQIILLPLLLKGLQAIQPDLNLDDYLHGVLAERVDVFFTCASTDQELKAMIAKSASPANYRPASPEAANRLRDLLGKNSLPRFRTEAPMLVAYGDKDPFLNSTWTAEGVRQGCALGDHLDVHVMAGEGHTLPISSTATKWLAARLAGQPAVNSCGAV
jgi:pimeloyl-ACP methyl ester carboxylesterase